MKLIAFLTTLVVSATVSFAAEPATRPVMVQGKVLVLPFAPIGEAKPAWIGSAVQQNLLAELSRVRGIEPVVTKDAPEAELSPDKARDLGERMGAEFVVYGSFQTVDSDLRITGQVLDVRNNVIKGGIKATGSLRDLFAVEDTLAQQVKGVLPKAAPQTEVAAAGDDGLVLKQPKAPAMDEPLQVNRGAYDGSDLQQAVRRGRANVPFVDDRYYQRANYNTYGTPYYGYPYWGYPIYGGYGYPFYHRPRWCFGTSFLTIHVPPTQDFSKTQWGNAQGYFPLVTKPWPNSVAKPMPR